jgi:dienelactone hydrolase
VRRILVALLATSAAAGCGASAAVAAWTGSYRLPAGADPVAITVQLAGNTATVALGPGHLGRVVVRAATHDGRMRFAVPGGVVFSGTIRGRTLQGSVSQGSLRGTFRLGAGAAPALSALGTYRSAGGASIALVQAAGFPLWLVELPSGNIHGLGASLATVGTTAGTRSGAGTLAVTATRIAWTQEGVTVTYDRLAVHQREVRIGRSAATLTLPAGTGPFPAVAMVHGSAPQGREEFQVFAAFCAQLGIAVLADDKRGIGESGGSYPGEHATPATIDALARDAQAEVRYLGTLPQIDPKRIGLLGDSQAGWIIALAAARERAVRWAVPLAGPTVSVDETDLWGSLAGKGVAPPSEPFAKVLAEVRAAGPGGFDPTPSLRRLSIPVFWVFADDDRNVPTGLCTERLQQLQSGHDFSWTVIHATHTLLELPSGLNADIPRSRGFGAGMFDRIAVWLRTHEFAGS